MTGARGRPGRTGAAGSSGNRNRAILGLLAAAAVALGALVLVVPRLAGPASGGPSPSTAASGDAFGASCPTSQPPALASGVQRTVTIETPKGAIVIQVEGSLGPNAAGNFLALAECGYYDNVVFHRLAPGFVIQGGDGQFGRAPNVDRQRVGQGGPGYEFPNDPVPVTYDRGIVAMANSGVDTNGSQFFICLADLATLPPSYSVFGRVVSGMETVDAIAAMPNAGGQSNLAIEPVPMTSITVSD